jgi:vacuolar-type H+-ATPase subunit F/Vma7
MYLVIKELSGIAEDVIMVTQSLIKDIQSKQETIYRANAIRALCLITDVRAKRMRYIISDDNNTVYSPL